MIWSNETGLEDLWPPRQMTVANWRFGLSNVLLSIILTSSNLVLGLDRVVCSETTQVPGAMPWSEPDLGNVHRAIGVYLANGVETNH